MNLPEPLLTLGFISCSRIKLQFKQANKNPVKLKTKLKILHLEDTPSDAELVERELKKGNIQFERLVVGSKKTALEEALKEFVPDIILCDHTIPSFDSFEAIRIVKQKGMKVPIILVSGTGSDEYPMKIMEAGAYDYILKDRMHRLPKAAQNTVEKNSAERQLRESEAFNRGILSSLSSQIAVIDQSGTLMAVNRAWDDFAGGNGKTSLERVPTGSNYFEVCLLAEANGDGNAAQALRGIKSVLEKERTKFEMEYPCHSGNLQRRFILTVSPFENDDTKVVISHKEITEIKILEKDPVTNTVKLQTVPTELNKILDSSLDVICTINGDGEFVTVSAAAKNVWGYSPEELKGIEFIHLVYGDDVDITSKVAKKIISGIQMPIFENRYVHKSGRLVPMLWSVNWDEDLELMFCVAKDVTDKKRLEKAVENQRDQFYDMFWNAPSAIGMLKGPDHVFEMVNPVYLQLTGKKDIIGKTVSEVFPEVIEQGFVDMLDHVYRTGESHTGAEVLVRIDKEGNGVLTDFYMNFIYQAYRHDEGEIKGVFFFINEITEHITAKKAIEKSEKQLRQIVETTQEGIWQLDENNRIIFVNKKICEILEYTEEEILGKKHLDFMDANGKEKAMMALERRKRGIAEKYELGFITKNEKQVLTNISATPIFDDLGNYKGTLGMVSDITEKRAADEKNRFKANLLKTIGQAAIATDMDGVVNYWNRAAENIYGWSSEEAIGKNIMYLTTPQATREQALAIMNDLKNGLSWSGEFRVQRRDGTDFPAFITNSPIYDENNQLSGIIGISSDITEKKNLEALLDKSNRLAGIGSWEVDVDNGTVFWSDITKEIYETEPDFIPDLENGIGFFTKGRNKKIITLRVQQCLEKAIPWDVELQLASFKGNLKWVRIIGQAEFVHGKCIKVYGSFQDITQRKKEVEKVIRSETKLKVAQHVAQVGSWEVDMSTNEHSWSDEFFRILDINEKVVPSDEAFLSFVHPDDRAMAVKSMKGAFCVYADSSFHFRFLRKNGETGYASSEWRYEFDPLRKPIYIHGILRDLTKEKRAEGERTKMISDIVQRNNDLEQFSYIVSHNLRAPVANILGLGELLVQKDYTQEVKKDFLDALLDNVNRLDTVITDLNSILQVKVGMDVEKGTVVLNDLVNAIKTSIQNLIERENVRFTINFTVPAIHTVQSYLHSILYNLMTNSIKYRRPGITTEIGISSESKGGSVVITFEDNGLGIDLDKKREQVFGLYKRFHEHIEGKGMGLFLVKTQVELLGGRISIESTVDVGTKFTITINQTTLE